MKIRTFFSTVFAIMFLLGSAPFFVSYFDARLRERSIHTLQNLKTYNDQIMAVGLQIRGIQNAFIRAALEKTAAGPDMDKLREVVVKRNTDLDALLKTAESSFESVVAQGESENTSSLNRDNFKHFMTSSQAYQKAIAKVLATNEFSTQAIDDVAPFINAALGEVGKEVKASNELIAQAGELLLSQGKHFQWVYILANGLILAFIVAAFVLMDRRVFRRLTIALATLERVKSGDLRVEAADGRASDEFSRLLLAIHDMAAELGRLIREIDMNASRLAENAESIHAVSEEVMTAAILQSDETSGMAAAIEEMTVSSAHISDRANETERYSSSSSTTSVAAAAQLDKANETIHLIAESVTGASAQISALNDSANQISNIASVIKDIAGQTNLLALNAAIEAARAGEQGRGFAVVADEVRKLAERTAKATSEIESMINGVQRDTGEAVGTMALILPRVEEGKRLTSIAAESLASIRNEAQQTLIQIQEITSSIREQSAASTSLAQKVDVVAHMAERTSVTSRTSTDIAEQLRNMANDLRQRISRFSV